MNQFLKTTEEKVTDIIGEGTYIEQVRKIMILIEEEKRKERNYIRREIKQILDQINLKIE